MFEAAQAVGWGAPPGCPPLPKFFGGTRFARPTLHRQLIGPVGDTLFLEISLSGWDAKKDFVIGTANPQTSEFAIRDNNRKLCKRTHALFRL